jgi:hypothetical protein
MASHTLDVVVTPDVRQFFIEAVINGQGGFQSFSRNIAARLRTTKVLKLTPDELRRLTRYAIDYGEGGYQSRFRKIVCSWVAQHADTLFTG